MQKIKLNISTQQVDSDTLDSLAHNYCGTRLTLSDDGEKKFDIEIDKTHPISIETNGCYSDAKEAVEEAFGATVTNKGNTYQRILDPAVKDVLVANMGASASEDGNIKEDSFKALTSIGTWFQGNTEIREFRELGKSGIVSLGTTAFKSCTNLSYVDAHNITSLSGAVFMYSGIKTFYCPATLKFDSNSLSLFNYCKSLISVFLPGLVKVNYIFAYSDKIRVMDFGKKVTYLDRPTLWCGGKVNLIVRAESIPEISAWWGTNNNSFPKRVFVSNLMVETWTNYATTNGGECLPSGTVHSIGGTEWQNTMQTLAQEEGVTLDSIHAKFPQYSNVGWDYEYIDYLIYGVEPPEE